LPVGWTALRNAVVRGHEKAIPLDKEHKAAVRLLLKNGFDVTAEKFDEADALRWAASCGHEAVLKLLLEKGADLESKNKDDCQTPLARAAMNGKEAVRQATARKGR